MKLWKYADFNENQLISWREGVAIIAVGLLVGGGLAGDWLYLLQWIRH